MLLGLLIGLTLAQGAPSLGQGRSFIKDLYEAKTQKLWREAGPGLKQQVGTPAGVKAFVARLKQGFGTEVRVISEGLSARGELTAYRRVAAFSNWARGVEIELTLDDDGRLMGMSARPASKEAPTTYGTHKPKTRLRVPFENEWYVLWGGRSWQNNRHSAVPDQRYALDLLQLNRAGKSFDGDGSRNELYLAWAQPVVAAGDGVIAVAEDTVPDNEPGTPRGRGILYGNHVVIDHGNGEYSLVAHLMHGSLQVKVGERVKAGQILARTGNSGMSSEPHIHYQLMDNADWRQANGYPALFQNFELGDRAIQNGEPRRGDLIRNATLEARR